MAGRLAELLEGPACDHAKTECSRFSGASERWEFFAALDCTLAFFELVAIKLRIRPVFGSNAADVTGRAWAQTVERAAAPVVDVVTAGKGGERVGCRVERRITGEVGDFVLVKTGLGGVGNEFFVHGAS